MNNVLFTTVFNFQDDDDDDDGWLIIFWPNNKKIITQGCWRAMRPVLITLSKVQYTLHIALCTDGTRNISCISWSFPTLFVKAGLTPTFSHKWRLFQIYCSCSKIQSVVLQRNVKQCQIASSADLKGCCYSTSVEQWSQNRWFGWVPVVFLECLQDSLIRGCSVLVGSCLAKTEMRLCIEKHHKRT